MQMNKVYKSVWNEALGAWVATSENSPARGKRSGQVAKAALASAIVLGATGNASAGALDGGTVESPTGVAIGPNAMSQDTGTIAIGALSYTDGVIGTTPPAGVISGTIAIGYSARSIGSGSIALGQNATVGVGAQAGQEVNDSMALGHSALTTGQQAIALGTSASASADGSVAIGTNSVSNRGNTVSIGNATIQRQLVQVARGTQTADAVNVSQITPVLAALGGNASMSTTDGSITAPTYTVKGTNYNNVGAALTALADAPGSNMYLHVNSSMADSTATGLESIAIGGAANAVAGGDIAIGRDSVANGNTKNAISLGVAASAVGQNAIVLGDMGTASADHAMVLGAHGTASAQDTVSLGYGATASSDNSVALGAGSISDRANSVSVGTTTSQRQITNVAIGMQSTDAVNVSQLQSVTTLLGAGATVNPDGTVKAPSYTVAGAAVGTVGEAIGKIDSALNVKVAYDSPEKLQVTLGGAGAPAPVKLTNVQAASLSSTSTDAVNGSQLNTTNQNVATLQTFASNFTNGGGIKYFRANSTLADSSAAGSDAVAIGGAANASAANSVALGSNSIADRANSVSIGSVGHERQITNVANGTSATDAVNFGQLTTVSNNVDTLGNFAVRYDANDDGTPDYQTVTLGGKGAAQTTRLTNLSNADLSAASTDAVNGSQLYATNQNVATLQGFANNITNGGGITYFHSNSTLADSSATGVNSVAIGGAAVASANNAIALGANSVADRANSVSVGASGSERQVTHVAAGTATTDAVNVGQLNAVSTAVTSLGASAIKYDTAADGTPDYANATLGNGTVTGTALHNVAAGTADMDAVNLGQFNSALALVANAADNAYNPLFSADGSRDTEVAVSSGTHSVASGANAVASGTNAIASGAGATASGANAVAVGANATASSNNSVALGANSVADRVNSVSVGTSAAGGQRQITNVAAGTDGTDAVNVNQMQQSVNTGIKSANGYTDALRNDVNAGLSIANNHINSVGAMSSAMAMMAGSAAAVADKDNRFAAGTGVYRNKAAIAVGFQKRFGNNMVLTLGGSTTGEESTGGAGFAFGF
jgi:autotransporter adhesin